MTTHRGGRARTLGQPADPSRPEPVLAAAAVPVVTAVLGLGVAFGVRMTDAQQSAVLAVAAAVAAAAVAVGNWWARRQVTPLADPRDSQGRPLVPVGVPGRPAP